MGTRSRSPGALRRGWTTGACATAATGAAYAALLTGEFPDPVRITLPGGQAPAFALTLTRLGDGEAAVAITKDAGDDPDVTHGAVIWSAVRPGPPGSGVGFRAGRGVGVVTRPGLPLPVGEPAINPVPRRMMAQALAAVAEAHGRSRPGVPPDVLVEIAVEDGEEIARHTWNPRLGIRGGISILGTTGIVVPYSCSAWIDSIRRGVDVARAAGHPHVAACTGSTSEATVRAEYALPDDALLDMGDFAGAVLKYLRRHPVPRLTVAGGFGKLAKLAEGHLDLHSGRSQVSLPALAGLLPPGTDRGPADGIARAGTALQALRTAAEAGIPLGDHVAAGARRVVEQVLAGAPVTVEVIVVDRDGAPVGRSRAPGWPRS